MTKSRSDYRRELVQAADSAAARILAEARTGVLYPHVETVKLMRQAWLAGHKAAKEKK
jgi:hypothetical protein